MKFVFQMTSMALCCSGHTDMYTYFQCLPLLRQYLEKVPIFEQQLRQAPQMI
jgi:hypothetical protein